MDNMFKFNPMPFIGVVTNINDPEKLGRVQVVAFGHNIRTEDDFKKVLEYTKMNFDSVIATEEDIPSAYWASVLSPTTSAGFSGIGTTHGLRPGSTVLGQFLDGETGQQPAIIGVFNGLTNQLKITQDNSDAREESIKSKKVLSSENYESEKTSSVNRLSRNEDIDKTIVDIKKKRLQQSNSAYSTQSHLSDIGKSDNLAALKSQISKDALLDRFKSSIKVDQIEGKLKEQLSANIANVVSPDKILNKTLSKIRDSNAALSATEIRELEANIMGAKCKLAKMADGILTAAMTAVGKAIAGQIAGAMKAIGDELGADILGEVDGLISEITGTIAGIENAILMAEAEALGAIANIVGGISDIALNIEKNITDALDDAIGGIMGEISGTMDGLINEITALGGSGESLAKIQGLVSDATSVYAQFDSLQNQLNADLTGFSSLSLDSVKPFIPSVDDYTGKAEKLLDSLNLSSTGC